MMRLFNMALNIWTYEERPSLHKFRKTLRKLKKILVVVKLY